MRLNRFPYQAHRLPNGNNLVGLANPGELLEVDKAGKVVRSIAGKKMDIRLGWVTGTQPFLTEACWSLTNGKTAAGDRCVRPRCASDENRLEHRQHLIGSVSERSTLRKEVGARIHCAVLAPLK